MVFQHYVISNLDKYFPHSDKFLPERWFQSDGVRHSFASLPFGYGRRMCLGRRFAELEMLVVISKVINFDNYFIYFYQYVTFAHSIISIYFSQLTIFLNFNVFNPLLTNIILLINII